MPNMKINIINYERDFNDGILTKYANKMHEELVKLGYDAKVDNMPDPEYDINHHINYLSGVNAGGDTLMVTHFTGDQGMPSERKLNVLRDRVKNGVGICFSQSMMDYLIKQDIPADKLAYVLPAHDGLKRRPIVIAILTKAYPDGRKREEMVLELAKVIDKEKFAFRIMGTGWRPIVEDMMKVGFGNIEYFEDFDLEVHKAILDSSDYLLYTGDEDEGAMSILDAAQAGLKIIAPLNGFHHEIGIEYPFKTQEELNAIFAKLSINTVEGWTWSKYVTEHIKIWEKILK